MTTALPPTPARLELRGPLDAGAVDWLRRRLAAVDVPDPTIRCEGVTAVDPVGAACLWLLCLDLDRAGRTVRLAALPARFARRLRLHPLAGFLDREDEVFADPFRTPVGSRR